MDEILLLINKYSGYFHDGAVLFIKEKNNALELWMESAELRPEWNEDNLALSWRKTIAGKLHLENINYIKEDEKIVASFKPPPDYEDGTIYDFTKKGNSVFFEIWWRKYFPEYEKSKVYYYEIAAEKIDWENIPILFNQYWDDIYNDKEPTIGD